MSEERKFGVSFAFGKKKEKVHLHKSSIAEEDVKQKTETDFITGIKAQRIESTQPKEENKPLVIPLINQNVWKTEPAGTSKNRKKIVDDPGGTERKSAKESSNSKPLETNHLDDEAVKEILKESAKYSETWESGGHEFASLSIPILMKNKVPEGFETDEKLDVSIRPDEAQEADYDKVPIEQFGLGMLRGMGWKADEGIGNKMKKVTKPVDAVLRPKGQGLGADRGPSKNAKGNKTSKNEPEESLEGFQKGAGVLVTNGPHKNLYGKVDGVDEDNSRVVITFAISGQSVTLSQFNVKSVSMSDYKKYSKDISKFSKANSIIEKQRKERAEMRTKDEDREGKNKKNELKEDGKSGHEIQTNKDEIYRHSKNDKDEMHKSREGARRKERSGDEFRDSNKEHSERRRGDKRRREDENSGKKKEKKQYSRDSSPVAEVQWLRPDLRVRFIDKEYKSGRYYNLKVKILDVLTRFVCTCRTDDGKFLDDIHQSMLETVIPRSDPGYVMIVNGKSKGQVGTILKRDKAKCQADIQLFRDKDKIVRFDYNDICEYIGDVQLMEDF